MHAAAIPPTRTRTDDEGRYRFENLAPGHVSLEIIPESDPPRSIELEVDEGVDSEMNVAVEEGMTVRGSVVDAATKRPIEGATVWRDHLLGSPRREVRTDAMGQFAFTGFPVQRDLPYVNGVELFVASAPGYALGNALVGKKGSALSDFVEIELDPAKHARGRVLDPSGKPIANAFVAVQRRMRPDSPSHATRTADDGRFDVGEIESTLTFLYSNEVGGAEPGKRPLNRSVSPIDHWLFIRAQGFATYSADFPSPERDHDSFEFGDIVLMPAASFSGRVVDESQHGLPDIQVFLWPTDNGWDRTRTARTDEFGRFGITDLSAGDYYVAAQRVGGRRVEQTVHITAGEQLEGVWLTLPAGEVIEGRVLDEDGRAARDVTVFAVRQGTPNRTSSASATTDDKGHFVEQGLESGTYDLTTLSSFGYRIPAGDCASPLYSTNTIVGVRSGDRSVAIVVKSLARLHGILLDADGRAVQGADVWADDPLGKRLAGARTDANGAFELGLPTTPTITICARAPVKADSEPSPPDADSHRDADVRVEAQAIGSRYVSLRLPRKP
jgi:protocatechuate 3,4-dioxygenase beta subunit